MVTNLKRPSLPPLDEFKKFRRNEQEATTAELNSSDNDHPVTGRALSTNQGNSLRPEAISLAVLTVGGNAATWYLSQPSLSYDISKIDWWGLFQHQLLWLGLVVGGALICVAFLLKAFGVIQSAIRLVPMTVLVFAFTTFVVYEYAGHQQRQQQQALDAMFVNHQWIAYESPSFFPTDTRPADAQKAKEWDAKRQAEIRKELKTLREQSNFDGLITFAPYDLDVPKIAKEVGFKAVIMTIYLDHKHAVKPDLEPAIRMKDDVAGYCLGHNPGVKLDELSTWMQELRDQTGKPVTTTFPLAFYLGERGREISEIGDWLMPDIHAPWQLGSSPEASLAAAQTSIRLVMELPRSKPVLLKMISYPSDGGPGLSKEAQEQFFLALGRDLWLPPGVHASIFNSYDLIWKTEASGFAKSEAHVGLLEKDGTPKPALQAVKQWPLFQDRE